jgi:anti-anti-sigma factor
MSQTQVAKISEVMDAVILELTVTRLDPESASQMIRDVMGAAKKYPSKPLIFDVGNLEFIRSSEIGAFVDISKQMRVLGRGFSLAGMKTHVRATFHVTRVDQLVKVYKSLYDAIGEI